MMESHDETPLIGENDMIIISSREQVAKKQALVTAEMLLEAYTANLEAKYASLIQSEQPISRKWSWLS